MYIGVISMRYEGEVRGVGVGRDWRRLHGSQGCDLHVLGHVERGSMTRI